MVSCTEHPSYDGVIYPNEFYCLTCFELWKQMHPIDPEVQKRAIIILQQFITPEIAVDIRKLMDRDGDNWISVNGIHFHWGMAVRNYLRENGLTDDLIPGGNWDDYYADMVEEVVKGYES
jgi:hypothetical protein